MVQGRAYTVHLDARSETEAEAELALFMRDPEGYRTRQEARQLKQEAAVLRHLFHQLPHLGIRRPHPPIRTSGVTGFLPTSAVTQDGEV